MFAIEKGMVIGIGFALVIGGICIHQIVHCMGSFYASLLFLCFPIGCDVS